VPGGGSLTLAAGRGRACRVLAHRLAGRPSRGCSETRGGRGPGWAGPAVRDVPRGGAGLRPAGGRGAAGRDSDDQPGPPVRSGRVADLRCGPSEDLLEQPKGVLDSGAYRVTANGLTPVEW